MEICVDKIGCAVTAANGGATRLELCSALGEGGLTPSIGVLKKIKQLVQIPVFCMVRCRPGNFTYSSDEIDAMREEAALLIENGADGIVFGALTTDGCVDIQACERLIEVVPKDKPMTFHRAFDWTPNPLEALKDIAKLKRFSRILTSGQQKTAEMGIDTLKMLVERTVVDKLRIKIMPGCGINKENITNIVRSSRAAEFHASASVFEEVAVHRNVNCSMGTQDDKAFMVSQETVAYMTNVVKCHKMDRNLGWP